ncbi:hypothetical protein [Nesterenkonia muleiensis]|uniref:hypothetical protein n=1 Tax=Nesterenkonia muleiensis TaxID=2282648 RepID=UPI000E73800F|nr:hypothetical protein [Nesterenkonia muleiensis]
MAVGVRHRAGAAPVLGPPNRLASAVVRGFLSEFIGVFAVEVMDFDTRTVFTIEIVDANVALHIYDLLAGPERPIRMGYSVKVGFGVCLSSPPRCRLRTHLGKVFLGFDDVARRDQNIGSGRNAFGHFQTVG